MLQFSLDKEYVYPNTKRDDPARTPRVARRTGGIQLRGSGHGKTSRSWVLKDGAGMDVPPPAKKTINLEGRLIKGGVRKAIQDRQNALHELLNAINQ
jgi:hypothetical protein